MQEVPMDDPGKAGRDEFAREQVAILLAALAERIGKDRYEVWFAGQTRLSLGSQALLIEAASRFHRDWLRNHFRRDLELVVAATLSRPVPLEFGIDSSLQPTVEKSAGAAVAETQTELFSPDIEATEQPAATDGSVATKKRTHSTPTNPPVRSRRYQQLSYFVVGGCNRLAHAAVMQTLETAGEPNPLLIYGATGTGKTHLIEGLISEYRHRYGQTRLPVMVTAEQFTSKFLEALHSQGLPSFRRQFRNVDLLIIDDIQFLAGKQATLTEFLHTIDTLLREHRQVVMTADRPAHELHELGRQLSTRVSGGMSARLDAPDQVVRTRIVNQLCLKYGLELLPETVGLLVDRLTDHVRELQGAVQRLMFATRLAGRILTLPEAESTLAELLHRRGHHWKLTDIEQAVCRALGLPQESLQSTRRAKSLNTTRMFAMWLSRKFTRAALSEIGEYFGRRSHSTVISAQKKVNGWVSQQATVAFGGKEWPIEEAVRRVEEALRAA